MSDHTQVVRDLYAAFERRDVGAVLRGFHADIELSQTPLLPWGGTCHGTMGAASFFQKLHATIDARVSVEDLVEAGETVVAVARTRGRVRSNDVRFDIRAVQISKSQPRETEQIASFGGWELDVGSLHGASLATC